MPRIEVDVPDHIDVEIERLVEEGDFISREEAIEEFLANGLTTYSTDVAAEEEEGDLSFADEMRNPGDEEPGLEDDDYAF